uniref:MFS domain-containing protein n=1 Tax=Heterorhabditis bacteriophora TaxID=37862 RepID=A0A1I7X3X4_HETBA
MVPATVSLNICILPELGLNAQMFTMFALSCERVISTIIPVQYEKVENKYLGIFLGTFSCISAIIFSYSMLLTNVDWSLRLTTFTVRVVANADRFQVVMLISDRSFHNFRPQNNKVLLVTCHYF